MGSITNNYISSAVRMIYRMYKRSEQLCSAWSGRQKVVVSNVAKGGISQPYAQSSMNQATNTHSWMKI